MAQRYASSRSANCKEEIMNVMKQVHFGRDKDGHPLLSYHSALSVHTHFDNGQREAFPRLYRRIRPNITSWDH